MTQHSAQIAIIGGGISGLWLLNSLRNAGYDAVLFEKNTLGSQQTFASQGMIHGGIKYALGGFTTPASETIADMPSVWRNCIAGQGPVDLKNLNLLSEDYYLFSDGSLSSKVTGFFASKSLRGRINALSRTDYPKVFANSEFNGSLYQLQDIVIDTPALISKLSQQQTNYIYHAEPQVVTDNGEVSYLQLPQDQSLKADRYIFAAGAGNAPLLSGTALEKSQMQTRPLQQVMLKGQLPSIYAHAVSLKTVAKPRITFSTHPALDGDKVWYLGGNLAEQGVGMTAGKLIDFAQRELKDLLPWIDLTNAEWATLNIDRAEPAQKENNRPDHPFLKCAGNCLVAWPTKLTLVPMLADMVLDELTGPNTTLVPQAQQGSYPDLPLAQIAKTPWENSFG
jgi:hypothetical protein